MIIRPNFAKIQPIPILLPLEIILTVDVNNCYIL